MSIFTSIGNFIGGLFSGTNAANLVSNVLTGAQNSLGYPHTTGQAASGGLDYSQSGRNFPGSNSGQGDSGNNMSSNQSWIPRYTPTPQGGGYTNQPGITPVPQGGAYSSGGSSGGSSSGVNSQPFIFDKSSSASYLKSAGLNPSGFDLTGKTEAEAKAIVDQQKAAQRGQVTANTSAVFADPNAVNNTSKKVDRFSLGLDTIKNDPWTSTTTKKDLTQGLLKATAKDIAVDYNTPQDLAAAYHNDPVAKSNLDKFIQAGGTDQMIGEAIVNKNTLPTGQNMSTSDYLASVNNKTDVGNLVPNTQIIQNEIARQYNIPEEMKKQVFGDANTVGLLQQRINVAQENINLLNQKLATETEDLNRQAGNMIAKNNAELEVAKHTIELNRQNAKNYVTGMLAKLGALNTTSAAVDSIANLDQKYQQQAQEAESKVNTANIEIQTKLQSSIHNIQNQVADKIQSVKEDLSKDTTDIQKEILKAKQASDKEIYSLSLKWNAAMKKNIDTYKSDVTTLAEEYAKNFSTLVSNGYDPKSVAANLPVNIPKADQSISLQARTKDPGAISLFKSLPAEFKYQWIDYANQQPPDRYFTREDIRQAYEAYQVDKNVPDKPKSKASSSTSVEDITV